MSATVGRHAGRLKKRVRSPRRRGCARSCRAGAVRSFGRRGGRGAGRPGAPTARAWGCDGELEEDGHGAGAHLTSFWSGDGMRALPPLPAAAVAVMAVGMLAGGLDDAACATEFSPSNEVLGSLAEGEDFWTNVLRYITFFITIVTGFITFAVKYVAGGPP